MEENHEIGIWSKLLFGGGRYVLGLVILLSGPLTLLFLKKDPTLIGHAIFHPLLAIFTVPQIIIGFYFMLTGKWKPRIDFTFFIVAAMLVYVFYTFALGFNT